MRPLSQALTALIGFAEETITRPGKFHGFRLDEGFGELAREIRRHDALPAEGVRTTRSAMVMIIALEEFFDSDREPTSRWLMVAGVTLPILRGEAWRAAKNEKEARPG